MTSLFSYTLTRKTISFLNLEIFSFVSRRTETTLAIVVSQ